MEEEVEEEEEMRRIRRQLEEYCLRRRECPPQADPQRVRMMDTFGWIDG